LAKGIPAGSGNIQDNKNLSKHCEQYGLAQQMRRAAVSIPSNIAEGYGRKHKPEYNQFLRHAYGSLLELQTQYLLSVDLGYTDKNANIEPLLDEVGAMLYRMFNPER